MNITPASPKTKLLLVAWPENSKNGDNMSQSPDAEKVHRNSLRCRMEFAPSADITGRLPDRRECQD